MATSSGSSGNDVLVGTPNADSIEGLVGNDSIEGLAGNDLLNGNQGFDTLNGGQGFDTLYGGKGNDSLRGGKGNDRLFGDVGNDTLWGDRGIDTLSGGVGDDVFMITTTSDRDLITDFGGGDRIGLADGQTFANLNILAGIDSTIIQDRITGQILLDLARVSPASIDAADFLTISPNTASSPTASSSTFNIQFDYRYDTSGFFSDPARRNTLEAVARNWESIIKDEFPDTPAGTETPFVNDPQTGNSRNFFTDASIDDLLVFVGARSLGGITLAESGPSGYFVSNSRYTGADFEPWIGSISFNSSTNWFFDQSIDTANDIPPNSYDFFSTALHEIAHVLGFGTSNAFENLTSGSSFTGANARAVNGGNSVPLEPTPDLAHILDGDKFGNLDPLMNPTSTSGVRTFATALDIAMLADIGYIV